MRLMLRIASCLRRGERRLALAASLLTSPLFGFSRTKQECIPTAFQERAEELLRAGSEEDLPFMIAPAILMSRRAVDPDVSAFCNVGGAHANHFLRSHGCELLQFDHGRDLG